MGLLTRLIGLGASEPRSLENPSTSLSDPAAWLVDWMTGGSTKAGATVNNVTALNLSAVWAAVRVLTDSIASVSLVTYERVDGGKERAPSHPAYDLLKVAPNPYMSAFTFWETLVGHLATWGNAYAEIERNGAGRPIALWPMRPDRTRVEWDAEKREKVYITTVNGQDIRLSHDNVLHIPGFGFDGLVGYNPIRIARESLGLTKAAEQFGSTFFGNGARVAGVLTHPKTLGEEGAKNLRKSWEKMHKGLSNSHRVAILEEGMEFKQVGIPPEDAQFLGTRKFQTSEIARWWRVPPHMIGDLERSTNNNIEQQSLEFVVYTLLPWVRRIEQPTNRRVFSKQERARFYSEFNVDDLLRGDSESRGKFYKEMWMMGAITQNEIRAKENMNSIPGGDQLFVPLNMIPLERATEPPAAEEGRERRLLTSRDHRSLTLRGRHAEAYKRVFRDASERVLVRELRQVRRALKKAFSERDATEFRAWLDEFYETFGDHVGERLLPVLRSYIDVVVAAVGDELGDEDLVVEAELERFVEEYSDQLGRRWSHDSVQQLRALLRDTEPDELEEVLSGRLDEWEEKRADKVATNETYRSGNAFAKAAYALAGVTKLRWKTTGSNCAYCAKMDGRIVGITGTFLSAGDDVEVDDGDPMSVRSDISHPPLHRDCDCFIIASL